MKFVLVTYLILNGLLGAESHAEMKSNDKSEVSSLTSSAKISNVLRDVLNQESLVRFSMTQRIQSLFMDALDNKNNSLILKQKLNDLSAELKSIAAEDQKMKEENAQLKQELDTVKQEMKTFMQQFQMINDSLQEHDSQLQNISTQQSSVNSKHLLHKSCMGILQSAPAVKGKDGVYSINVDDQEKKVYCDMTTDGGGWTVIQKREDGSTDFFRNWTDYKQGFGDPSKNYWIGNDAIHTLTVRDQELRVDLQSFDNQAAYALYSEFKVGNESTKYRLTVGGYSGTAGHSLRRHNGHKFSTRDQDNDAYSGVNCAVNGHGAWWYGSCAYSNLNGQYGGPAMSGGKYLYWYYWKSNKALKGTKIMIRPKS